MLAKMWSNRSSHSAGGMQNATATLEDVCQFLTEPNIVFLYHPAVMLLDAYQNDLKNTMSTQNG